VLNASLAGLVEGLFGKAEIYPVHNGYQGLVGDRLYPLSEARYEWIRSHHGVPGACLGSGRYEFTPERMEQAVLNLKREDIHTLAFIGGNGTMYALKRLGEIAEAIGYELQIVGIPKTVDNDLGETDHAPGFASAARFVAMSVRNIVKDLEAMRNFEQVRIIETMGRNAGWLALSGGYLWQRGGDGPHLIYVPEMPVSPDQILDDVERAVRENGIAAIVVSEGFAFAGEATIKRQFVNGRAVLGGISGQMEKLIHQHLGYHVRSENLGMNQRCASFAVSSQDRREAYETGGQASAYIMDGASGIMVNIQRQPDQCYNYIIGQVSLERVVDSGERLVPPSFIADASEYYAWLEPILGEPIASYPPNWKRGVCDEPERVYP
jgi:6-phosphofructokinase 1